MWFHQPNGLFLFTGKSITSIAQVEPVSSSQMMKNMQAPQ